MVELQETEQLTNTHLDSEVHLHRLMSFFCMIAEVTSLTCEEHVYMINCVLPLKSVVGCWNVPERKGSNMACQTGAAADRTVAPHLSCVLPVNTAESPLYMRKQRLSDTCSAFSR